MVNIILNLSLVNGNVTRHAMMFSKDDYRKTTILK